MVGSACSEPTAESCAPGEIQCTTFFGGSCVTSAARCNGSIECTDGRDEGGCPSPGKICLCMSSIAGVYHKQKNLLAKYNTPTSIAGQSTPCNTTTHHSHHSQLYACIRYILSFTHDHVNHYK